MVQPASGLSPLGRVDRYTSRSAIRSQSAGTSKDHSILLTRADAHPAFAASTHDRWFKREVALSRPDRSGWWRGFTVFSCPFSLIIVSSASPQYAGFFPPVKRQGTKVSAASFDPALCAPLVSEDRGTRLLCETSAVMQARAHRRDRSCLRFHPERAPFLAQRDL